MELERFYKKPHERDRKMRIICAGFFILMLLIATQADAATFNYRNRSNCGYEANKIRLKTSSSRLNLMKSRFNGMCSSHNSCYRQRGSNVIRRFETRYRKPLPSLRPDQKNAFRMDAKNEQRTDDLDFHSCFHTRIPDKGQTTHSGCRRFPGESIEGVSRRTGGVAESGRRPDVGCSHPTTPGVGT